MARTKVILRRVKRKTAGTKALKMVRSLKRLVAPEKKFFDTDGSLSQLNAASIIDFSLVPQGDLVTNRTGNIINPLYIKFRATAVISSAAKESFLRVIFFRPINNQAVLITASEILQAPTKIDSPLEWVMSERARVISDQVYPLSTGGRGLLYINKTINLRGKHIKYFGSATGTPETSGIYVLFLSSESVNGVNIDYYNRLVYTDC